MENLVKESSGEPGKRIQWRTPETQAQPATKNPVENPLDQARTRGI